jgi:predicted phage terminase large subunit-like protein
MCYTVLIEDKANGPAILTLLKNKVTGLVPVSPDASKDERLHAVAPIFESGNVFLPMNHPMRADIVYELTTFPASDHDDIVDALSQGLTHFYSLSGIDHLAASTRW